MNPSKHVTINFNAFDWINPVYLDYIDDTTEEQHLLGGSGSGKSVFLAQRTVIDLLRGENYLIVRARKNTLETSVWNEIHKVIQEWNLEPHFDCTTSPLMITCKLNLTQALFGGLDDVSKLKSMTPIKGVITRIWIEEATEKGIRPDDIRQLFKRLRGGDPSRLKTLTMSYNPIDKNHWICIQYFKGRIKEGLKTFKTENYCMLRTTYRDNKYLTPDDIRRMEAETDQYYVDVYSNGIWGTPSRNGRVWKGWNDDNVVDTYDSQYIHIYGGYDRGFSHRAGFVVIGITKDYQFDVLEAIGKAQLPIVSTDGAESRLSIIQGLHTKHKVEYWFCSHEASEDISIIRKSGIKADSWIALFGRAPTEHIKDTETTKSEQRYGFIDLLIRKNLLKVLSTQTDLIDEIMSLSYKELPDGSFVNEIVKENDDIVSALTFACAGYWKVRAEVMNRVLK